MKTNFESMRDRLLSSAGIFDAPSRVYSYEELSQSEWSTEFEQLMRNRLIIGALRYGKINATGKRTYDRIAGARKRLAQYAESGNLECLVDVANMMLLEFVEGKHPRRHWSDIHGDHCHV